LLAVEAVNHSKDYMAARKLIAERALMHPDKLATANLRSKKRSDAEIVFTEPAAAGVS